MLVHGAWPSTTKPIWKLNSLRVAIRINGCKSSQRKQQKVVMPMPKGWSELRRYFKTHDEVGGVTNGQFQIEVRSIVRMDVPLLELPHVSGLLGDTLDPTVNGSSTSRTPLLVEINTFRGLLDWSKRRDFILAPTIYHKTHGVNRNIAPTEMALVMDLPVCRTERMMESDLFLLIDYVIPGKVVQSAIHIL